MGKTREGKEGGTWRERDAWKALRMMCLCGRKEEGRIQEIKNIKKKKNLEMRDEWREVEEGIN